MWTKIKIWEIRKDALLSLRKDINDRIVKDKFGVILYYNLIPLTIAIIFLIIGVTINSEIANYFITAISIFAGLFFNLLLVVADKLNERKKIIIADSDEETVNYVKRYTNFSEQLISQISYTIVLSLLLIVLMFLIHFKDWLPNFEWQYIKLVYHSLKCVLNGMIFYFGVQFIVMLFVILSSMYTMLLDDIKIKLPK